MTKLLIDRAVVEHVMEALEADNSKLWPSEKRAAAITSLRERLEQPQVEQEPVAWMDTETRVLYDHDTSEVDQHHGFKPTVALYIHPQPKREPLTDEQITELADAHMEAFAQFVGAGEVWFEGEKEFARAIERAHGITGEQE